jgi:intracellular septation protein A
MATKPIFSRAEVRSIAVALVLAAVFLLGTHALAADHDVEIFALFLALTACVYGGATLNPAASGYVAVELPVVLVVFGLAVAGLLASPQWLAVGYIAHSIWDTLHHYNKIRTPIVRAFPPVCAIFDLVVGVAVLI